MAQAEPQPASAGAAFTRTFPCTGCGAKLSYAPGTLSLTCEFCGTRNAIAGGQGLVEEQDFAAELHALESQAQTYGADHVRCEKCGAEQDLPDALFAARCAFCGTAIVSKSYANRLVKPQAMVPFQVPRARAQDAFRSWVRRRWLAPGDLKRYAQSDAGINGIYIPFWTYDCRTASDYRGERGDDYYVDQNVQTTNARGETVVATQRRRQTRWSAAAGHVAHFHDDVLVMASTLLPRDVVGATERWNLSALVPYQAEFVSGFQAQAYQVGLKEAFAFAKAAIDEQVATLVRRDIGGDQQRIHSVATIYSDIAFKHVLLPVWVSAYRYRDKAYRFIINGQTGEVSGESPKSWWKVALLALAVLAVLGVILVLGSR